MEIKEITKSKLSKIFSKVLLMSLVQLLDLIWSLEYSHHPCFASGAWLFFPAGPLSLK
jgi:hypothetical protein